MILLDMMLELGKLPVQADGHPVVVLGAGETEWEVQGVSVEGGKVRLSVDPIELAAKPFGEVVSGLQTLWGDVSRESEPA